MNNKTLKIKNISVSNTKPVVIIAGPCVIEDEKSTLDTACALNNICKKIGIGLIFKASYDKANRSSIRSYRGPGIDEGLRILNKVRETYSIPVLTDVHVPFEAGKAARFVDVLQVPAFLSRQTDLILACANSGLPVNIKKGQFMAAEDMKYAVKKAEISGKGKIMLTERGTSFGYHNLVVDMRSIDIMKKTGYPVIFDATHSVQLPGAEGGYSGGRKEFVMPLVKASAALGIAGVFVEVHKNPKKALSDGANSLDLKEFSNLAVTLFNLDKIIKKKFK